MSTKRTYKLDQERWSVTRRFWKRGLTGREIEAVLDLPKRLSIVNALESSDLVANSGRVGFWTQVSEFMLRRGMCCLPMRPLRGRF